MDNEDLKVVFSEVLRGYTLTRSPSYKKICIKHFTNFDSAELDIRSKSFYDKATKEGLTNRKDRIDYLIKEGIWTEEKNKEILNTKTNLAGLQKTKEKVFLQAHIDQANKEIEENQINLAVQERDKEELIGFTAEAYASRRINEHYMYNALLNEDRERLFSKEEFDELGEGQMVELIGAYNKSTKKFKSDALKRISVSGFFTNLFYLCSDNPFVFFGKSVVELTFYQIELFGYGRYYKNMIENSENKPPEEISRNPEKLVEWFESSKSARETLDKSKIGGQDGSATSLVGASKEDLKRLGLDNPNETINLAKKAAEKGGSLTMDDMMKLHGM
jgi:hypothetical protein